MCREIRINGVIPDTVDELTKLPSVGRKTANLVVGDILKPAVDGYALHVSWDELNLTESNVRSKSKDLPQSCRRRRATTFVTVPFYGRAVCTARNPKCFVLHEIVLQKNPVNPIE